jgi:hypothetical protein
MSAAVSGANDRVSTSSAGRTPRPGQHRYMLGDPPYQIQIMGDEHQREALPPQIVGQSHDDQP